MKPTELSWKEPVSLETAEAEALQLLEDISKIETQLGSKNRTDASGQRLSTQAYWDWRIKARTSLHIKLSQYRRLRKWIRARRGIQGHVYRVARTLTAMSYESVADPELRAALLDLQRVIKES